MRINRILVESTQGFQFSMGKFVTRLSVVTGSIFINSVPAAGQDPSVRVRHYRPNWITIVAIGFPGQFETDLPR
jgi:hypothetical protein